MEMAVRISLPPAQDGSLAGHRGLGGLVIRQFSDPKFCVLELHLDDILAFGFPLQFTLGAHHGAPVCSGGPGVGTIPSGERPPAGHVG